MLHHEEYLQEISNYWSVTEELGFLPSAAQEAHSLTNCGFAELVAAESLAKDLLYIEDTQLLEHMSTLGEITTNTLHSLTAAQTETAVRAYAFIASRLIHHGHLEAGRTLDSRVARPLWWLAQRIGRAPILTYATYILANWQNRVLRRNLPENFNVQKTFTGTPDEALFVAVHLSIESAGGETIEGLARREDGITNNSVDDVVAESSIVESALRWPASVFPRIEERLDVAVFAGRVRKFLFGYQDVRFGGVTPSLMVSYIGETGAQSGAIRAADDELGVMHSVDVLKSMMQFLSYAPARHRFCLDTATESGAMLTRYLRENSNNAKLCRDYRDARAALGAFRDTHRKAWI